MESHSGDRNRAQHQKIQQMKPNQLPETIRNQILDFRKFAIQSNLIGADDLRAAEIEHIFGFAQPTKVNFQSELKKSTSHSSTNRKKADRIVGIVICIGVTALCILIGAINTNVIDNFFGIRCFVPNNYFVWEATRPISNCRFCEGIRRPLILPNMTQNEFLQYAYLPQPIIIKNAIAHWPARTQLTYQYLKQLYEKYPDSLEHFEEECQFLPFKSSFGTLREFFHMHDEQINTGKPSWYVGFSNCQSNILSELRQLYPRPHFLPKDAEIPNTDYTFLGYDEGAVMHLDYIPRLMWQVQLQGNKTWKVSPTPECDNKCSGFTFYVEPGDAVLIDTRIWYHGTTVTHGQFSMTIQSEYG